MRLILVRHPMPRCERGLCYGRLDVDCDADALDTAVIRLSALAETCRIVTSPARRAHELAKRLGADIAIEPRLQELHFGDWEGRLWQDLGREAIETWQRGLPQSPPPNGETLSEMAGRCAAWLASLEADGPPVMAVTHAGPIRVIRALLNREPLLTYFNVSAPFAEPLAVEAGQYPVESRVLGSTVLTYQSLVTRIPRFTSRIISSIEAAPPAMDTLLARGTGSRPVFSAQNRE